MSTDDRRSSCSIRWKPTSPAVLETTETKILSNIKTKYESKFVVLPTSGWQIRTLVFNPEKKDCAPLVMVHGFGGAAGLWVMNIDDLAKNRCIYVFDLLGFGRSDRPSFSKKPERAEKKFVDSIEEWRRVLDLEKFVLLGHSFGAYVASAYTIQHPERVHHLIIADGWGFSSAYRREIPMRIKVIATLLKPFNPLAVLRVAGPWGPDLVKRFRPDLQEKFAHLFDADGQEILDYIYHCNARNPSGETAMRSMSTKLGRAIRPMVSRIHEIPADIPITIIQGEESWLDGDYADDIKKIRADSFVEIKTIPDAGHHLYADQPHYFNHTVIECIKSQEGAYKSVTLSVHMENPTSSLICPSISAASNGNTVGLEPAVPTIHIATTST